MPAEATRSAVRERGGELCGRCALQDQNGGAGVYSMDERKLYQLRNPDWKHDIVPEIVNGHNIADFVDPDIEEKLKALELEEEEQAEEWLKTVRHLSMCSLSQLAL